MQVDLLPLEDRIAQRAPVDGPREAAWKISTEQVSVLELSSLGVQPLSILSLPPQEQASLFGDDLKITKFCFMGCQNLLPTNVSSFNFWPF